MSTVHGITDLAVFTSLGQPAVRSTSTGPSRPLRAGAGRHQRHHQGGDRRRQAAGDLYEDGSDRNFPDHRPTGAGISREPRRDRRISDRRARSAGNGVMQIPLSEVARLLWCRARPTSIAKHRSVTCRSNSRVRGRDLGGAVSEAQDKIAATSATAARLSRSNGSGEFGEFQDALQAAGGRWCRSACC